MTNGGAKKDSALSSSGEALLGLGRSLKTEEIQDDHSRVDGE